MKTSRKVLLVTVVLGIIAFLLEPNSPLGGFWAPPPNTPAPTGIQIPLFILLGLVEGLVFGLGVSFLIFGYPLVKTVPMSRAWSILTFLSIGWLLVNWFPHDSFHAHNGQELSGLLAIEYGFHLTLMAAGIVVAIFFLRMVEQVVSERGYATARVSGAAHPVRAQL